MSNASRRARLAPAEERAHAAATLPTASWWTGPALWIVVTLVVGALYRLLVPTDLPAHPGRLDLLRLTAAVAVNSGVVYWACYFTARQSLSRRGLRELVRSGHQRAALNRSGLPLLLPVAALLPLASTGTLTAETASALTVLGSLFSIYRALTTAYTAHYFEFVASPSEQRTIENDEMLKGRLRRAAERVATTLCLNFPRQRLALPALQTLLVGLGLQQAIVFVVLLAAGEDNSAQALATLGWVAPALPVVSTFLWARWHLAGGLRRIIRLGDGRSMKSFGWQHPDLAAARP